MSDNQQEKKVVGAYSVPAPKQDKRRLYADFLKRKADEAPDSGLVWISASDAEAIAILLRDKVSR